MNNWLVQHEIILRLFLFYGRKLMAHCLHAGQLLVELLRNGIRTMSRIRSFCEHLLQYIGDESIPHKCLLVFQLISSISFPKSLLCSFPILVSFWHEKVSRCCPSCGDPWIPSAHHIHKHLTHLILLIFCTMENCPDLNLLHRNQSFLKVVKRSQVTFAEK